MTQNEPPRTPPERGYAAGIMAALKHLKINEMQATDYAMDAEGWARAAREHLTVCEDCTQVVVAALAQAQHDELEAAMKLVMAAGYEISRKREPGK